MAQAKVSIEALVRMAQTLRQGADDILSSKADMDTQLRSFVWDDPIGLSFAAKYEEDFKPLKEKFIPAIEDYLDYINNLGLEISEYEKLGIAAGGLAMGGIVHSATGGRAPVEAGKVGTPAGSKKFVFSRKDDYAKLTKDPRYSRRYQSYLKTLNTRKPNILYSISTKDIDKINSDVFGLSEDELYVTIYQKEGTSVAGRASRNIARINQSYVSSHNLDACQSGAIGAHESTHVLQYKVYKGAKHIPYTVLSNRQKEVLEHFLKIYPSGSEEYYKDPMEIDARISEYAFNDACREYLKRKK